MSADPLSDTLAVTNARCAVSGGFSAEGAWAIRFPPPDRLKITAVVKGRHWLCVDDTGPAVLLEAGDVAVFDGRSPFVLASDPALEPVDASQVFPEVTEPVVHLGEDEEVVSIGGHIDLGAVGKDLLLQALPPLIHLRATADEAAVLRWLLDQLLQEMTMGRAGAGFASDQLAQLVFVQVLRACLRDSESFPAGWLRALGDARIAPALRLMHNDPGRSWQLKELAKAADMSRTTFSLRFKAAAGVPPLTYLLNWRMRVAARALREEGTRVSTLALSLGYTSESAFSNAFKRTIGIAPKRYRDAARVGASA